MNNAERPKYQNVIVLNQYYSKLDDFLLDDFDADSTEDLIDRLIDEYGYDIVIYINTYDDEDCLIDESCIYDYSEGGVQE